MIAEQQVRKSVEAEQLVLEYLQNKNPQIREQVVIAYMPMVMKIAGRVSLANNAALERSDLIQSGTVGLLKALETFEPERQVKFNTFAYKRIQGEIYDSLRKEGVISRHQINKIKRLEKAIVALRKKLGRDPYPMEICEDLQISETEYYATLQSVQLTFTMSLQKPVMTAEGYGSLPIELLEDETSLSPAEQVDLLELKDRLKHQLGRLDNRKRTLLALYYVEELTLAQIGEVLGLSEARVSQILNESLLELRVRMGSA